MQGEPDSVRTRRYRVSLRAKLILGFLAGVTLLAVLAALLQVSDFRERNRLTQWQDQAIHQAAILSDLKTALREVQRYDPEALSRPPENAATEADGAKPQDLAGRIAQVNKALERVGQAGLAPELTPAAGELPQTLELYAASLARNKELKDRLAHPQDGLNARLRQQSQELQAIAAREEADGLMPPLLALAQAEAQVLGPAAGEALAPLRQAMEQLKGKVYGAALPTAQETRFFALLDDYLATAEAILETRRQLGETEAGQRAALAGLDAIQDKLAAATAPGQEAMLTLADQERQPLRQVFLGLIITAALVGLGALILLCRNLAEGVSQTVATVEAASQGNVQVRMGREGRDEFARIAGAINQWLETGQQANLQEDQSRIELEEENMALHLEVSQLRHLREELKEARRKYETSLEQAPVAMLLAQPQGQVLEANRRAQQLWGLSRDELVGRPLATLFTAEWPAALAAQILESQGVEFSQPCPIAIITRDGNEAPVALNMAFLSQDPPGLIHLALWEAPSGAASQAEAPSMPDTQFLADISREMQLQLNHLLNTSLALQEGVSPEMSNGRFEKLADIVGSGQRLLELTDNLEDILDAKFKRRKLEPATCTIKDILQGAMDSAVAAASRQRVVMTAETLPAADLLVHADPGVLRKVVAQLVHNAVKLSPQGGEVQVKARLANAVEVKGLAPASAAGADLPTSQGGYLTIQVSDQGIGVSPEDLPRLCEKMTPMDHLYKTQFAGAGVSLVLAKSLTALHGGVIWADCQVGRGSTFTVVLPQRQSVAEPMPRLAEPEAAAEAQATADDHEAGALPAAQSA